MIKEAIAKLIKKENLTTEMMEQVMEGIFPHGNDDER